MNPVHPKRMAARTGAAALLLALAWTALPAASQEASPLVTPEASPLTVPTPPVSLTPLPMSELGPRTEPINYDLFNRIQYVSPVSKGWARKTGERAYPWSSLEEALSKIDDAGPDNRYALLVAGSVYKALRLKMKPYVDIYGGFDPATWQRDIALHPSILDGGQAGPILYGASNARLDGFTLRNARSDEPGGAILCRNASPWISNNHFTANRTEAGTPMIPGRGGEPAGNPGGAIACIGAQSYPLIERNIFAFNSTSDGDGGAIAIMEGADARVQLNVLAGNIAGIDNLPPKDNSRGGAIACTGGAQMELSGNLMINNLAGDGSSGGAVYAGLADRVRIRRNVIAGNSAGGSGGGVFAIRQKGIEMTANLIAGNAAGAYGGGLAFETGCAGTVMSSLICRNRAGSGGGVVFNGVRMTLGNNTIVHNRDEEGAGVLLANTGGDVQRVRIVNSIVYFNEPLPEIEKEDPGESLSLAYSVIGERWTGDSLLTADPRLSNDNYSGKAATMQFDPRTFQTRVVLVARQFFQPRTLEGRVINVGVKSSVIVRSEPRKDRDIIEVWVWGDMTGGGINQAPIEFDIPPTYRPLSDSPCINAGITEGAHEDLYNNPPAVRGDEQRKRVIGAIDYIPAAPMIKPELLPIPEIRQ